MISIVKGQENQVLVTVTELTTISNPTYLFAFYREENQQGAHYQSCIAEDLSEYPERYNDFTIRETTNPVALNGEVELMAGVAWYYTIYAQTSTTNLDPANADEVVEQGKVFVTGTSVETPTYTYTKDKKIYDPNN